MNYFELYQIPERFIVDKAAVKKNYYLLSKQYHPDFFDASLGITEEENLKLSSQVNEAYTIFQNSNATLQYILELKGIVVKDEKYQLPPDFLMEVMELNEHLDAATETAITTLKNEIEEPVTTLLQTENINQLSAADWTKLKEYYYKLKYLNRLEQRNNGQEWFD